MVPHTSPVGPVFGAGLKRSQSTSRLPLTSSHARVSWLVERRAELLSVYNPPKPAACRYFPMFHLTEVLPVPNTSHAAAHRGVTSLYFTPSAAVEHHWFVPSA